MWDNVEQWYAIKEAIGISCSIGPQGTMYNVCRVKREKDVIDIAERKSFAENEVLFDYLATHRQLPVALQLQGRGILIKEISPAGEIGKEHILPIFPNYREEDYVFGYFEGARKGWLTLARIELVEGLLAEFEPIGVQVVRLFIGPFVTDNILDQLNGYSGHFSFDGHQIARNTEEKHWESYRYDPAEPARFSIKVQGADIAEQYVVPYATAFSLLMHRFVPDLHITFPLVDRRLAEHVEKLKFKVNGLVMLIVFFVLLLINTAVYTHYQGKYESIDYQTKEQFSNANEIGKLSETAGRNDSLLVSLGWNGGLQKSWLLNQLALSLKGKLGMEWQEVQVNPLVTRRFGGTQGEVDNRFQIRVAGSCTTLGELESWVRTLGQQPWLKQVEISKFIDQNKPNSTRKDFVVTMHYTYDF